MKGKCLVKRSAKKVFQRSKWRRKGKSLGKVAEGQDASRKYVARVGVNWGLRFLSGSEASELEAARVFLKTRQTRYVDGQSRNDGEQFERCGLAGQSFFFTAAFLNILSENVLLCRILAVVWQRCWYTEATFLNVGKPQ